MIWKKVSFELIRKQWALELRWRQAADWCKANTTWAHIELWRRPPGDCTPPG